LKVFSADVQYNAFRKKYTPQNKKLDNTFHHKVHNMPSSLHPLILTKRFLAHFAIISLILEQFIFVSSASAALPITPDGSTNTVVTTTASGVDQINIATPNSNGLSHNKFTNYNVNASGQILNNFSGAKQLHPIFQTTTFKKP
jgi:hypothetical protein